MAQIPEFISSSLHLANYVKFIHWTTDSYAIHKATDKFVEAWSEKLDKFVEVYSGTSQNAKKSLMLKSFPFQVNRSGPNSLQFNSNNLNKVLSATLNEIDAIYIQEIPSELKNILDDLKSEIRTFQYLLTLK